MTSTTGKTNLQHVLYYILNAFSTLSSFSTEMYSDTFSDPTEAINEGQGKDDRRKLRRICLCDEP